MADGATIKVVGAERLSSTMRAAGREMEHMDSAGAKVQAQITRDARGRAPRRTGRLARSITGRTKNGDVEVGSSLVYAGPIHYGWPRRHISAQPFLTDALAASTPRVVNIYRDEVERSLDHVKGSLIMADAPKIETPHVRVTYADGRRVSVKTDNPDMVFYDIERAKRKWPAGQDAPMLWVNYLAYSKLRRTGEIERALTFEDWLLTTAVIENLDDNDELSAELATVGPTQPAPESD